MIKSWSSTAVQIFISIHSVGLLPRYVKYYGFVSFFPGYLLGYTVFFYFRAHAQVELVDGFSQFMAHMTCFRPGRIFWGLRQYRNSLGGNIPKTPQKGRELAISSQTGRI